MLLSAAVRSLRIGRFRKQRQGHSVLQSVPKSRAVRPEPLPNRTAGSHEARKPCGVAPGVFRPVKAASLNTFNRFMVAEPGNIATQSHFPKRGTEFVFLTRISLILLNFSRYYQLSTLPAAAKLCAAAREIAAAGQVSRVGLQ
jgi:hypothetical protein